MKAHKISLTDMQTQIEQATLIKFLDEPILSIPADQILII